MGWGEKTGRGGGEIVQVWVVRTWRRGKLGNGKAQELAIVCLPILDTVLGFPKQYQRGKSLIEYVFGLRIEAMISPSDRLCGTIRIRRKHSESLNDFRICMDCDDDVFPKDHLAWEDVYKLCQGLISFRVEAELTPVTTAYIDTRCKAPKVHC